MTSRAVLGRRTRAGVALISALGALVALAGLAGVAAAPTGPAAAGTSVYAEEAPFSFD